MIAAAYSPPAEAAGDRIRKIVIVSGAQAADPQEFQAAQLIAQEWRKLGLEVEVRGLPRPQVSDIVWYNRDKWDVTMWRMVGRPERSDPDELIYNLFHSSTREKGFNFVGYQNPNYDKVAEAQRSEIDQAKRKVLVHQAQDMIMADLPYLFLVYPKNVVAYSSNVWKKDTIVDQSGIGVRNFWTFIGATPAGSQKDMVLNAAEALNAVNPLYISGAIDSWVTDLVWDRLMRVGPDGLPKPWSAESVTFVDPTTVEAKLRPGQTWHDGKPLTVEDVIFSFEAPAGDKSPMYKPFVAEHRQHGEGRRQDHPLQAEGAERVVLHLDARQDQPDPEARVGADPVRQRSCRARTPRPIRSRSRSAPARSRWCASSCRRKSCSRRTRATGRRRRWIAGSCASSPTPRRRSACCGAARSISSPTIAAIRKSSTTSPSSRRSSKSPRPSTWASASSRRTCAGRRSTT